MAKPTVKNTFITVEEGDGEMAMAPTLSRSITAPLGPRVMFKHLSDEDLNSNDSAMEDHSSRRKTLDRLNTGDSLGSELDRSVTLESLGGQPAFLEHVDTFDQFGLGVVGDPSSVTTLGAALLQQAPGGGPMLLGQRPITTDDKQYGGGGAGLQVVQESDDPARSSTDEELDHQPELAHFDTFNELDGDSPWGGVEDVQMGPPVSSSSPAALANLLQTLSVGHHSAPGSEDSLPPLSPGGNLAASSSAGSGSESIPAVPAPKTTLMLRNLPKSYTRTMLMELLDSQGFCQQYDFLYLPIDFRTHGLQGYAFVNFCTPEVAQQAHKHFDSFHKWSVPSNKKCSVSWSDHKHGHGFEANVARYQNSPLMHESVPDHYRPVLLSQGCRIPFPPPTKRVKPPRQGTERMLVS